MPREIISKRDELGVLRSPKGEEAGTTDIAITDDYKDRLLKYIPAEVVAAYLAVQGIVPSIADAEASDAILLIAFLFLLIATPFYLRRVANITKKVQLSISTASFFVWVMSVGGPFTQIQGYDVAIGAVVLILFTFSVPIIEP